MVDSAQASLLLPKDEVLVHQAQQAAQAVNHEQQQSDSGGQGVHRVAPFAWICLIR